MRVQAVVEQLNNEKIDIVKWDDDPEIFVANALNPAEVIGVDINKSDKIAEVVVPDFQLSLAIGKEGQNARLAAKLTGWKVDIKKESEVEVKPDNIEEIKADASELTASLEDFEEKESKVETDIEKEASAAELDPDADAEEANEDLIDEISDEVEKLEKSKDEL